ncbi:hypothetical protein [Methanoregula sp.]|uniref:hypothetical protein n=1 Tax=Methanoregula sp. TaxID=2052170 RepID=UPI002C43812D|nr:hypothetical protein [Methanoregula sp.]HVP96915.1 hypothetical protein [Methanoregula sp.]
MDYNSVMKEARKYVKDTCNIDSGQCFGSPGVTLMSFVTTAMSAIQSGITTDSFETVAEGQAILEQAVEILKNNPMDTI